ncbi:S8 family serine peptidase [Mariniphaga anaerophila]|nr:S8 family serine peptidase [Mariniphaga anaerophila]
MVLLSFAFGSNVAGQSVSYSNGMQKGVVRIKIKPELSGTLKEQNATKSAYVVTGFSSFDKLNKEVKATQLKRVFKYSPKHEDKLIKHGLNLWYEIKVSGDTDIKSVVSQYKKLEVIELAEPIYEKSLINPGTPVRVNSIGTKSVNADETLPPFNDPYLPRQWHYNNTGQSGFMPGADINLFKAWEIETGSNNVVVSIHDMGVQCDHEDLASNMWTNQAELNGKDGVDDDGNGYVDDIYGFNFADNVGGIIPGDHGTHVAGTVAAVNNNGIGVSGVAGGDGTTPGVKVMSCQILGGVSQGNTPDSYVYAANNGAVISQNSWGYQVEGAYEQSVLDAIDYFIAEAGNYEGSPMKGGVVIFAAGNSYVDGDWYPGCYENVLAVASLDAKNEKAGYSNYGTWIDISAPGGELEDNTEEYYSNGVLSTLKDDGYGYMDGTSMACPHVSGVAALVVSQFGSAEFTPVALKTHLLTGINDIYKLAGNAAYAGQLGKGSTNAYLALGKDEGVAPDAIANLTVKGISQDFVTLEWVIPADEDDEKPVNFQILYSKQNITAATQEYAKKDIISVEGKVGDTITYDVQNLDALTEYYFAVRSIDRWSNVSEFSNIVTAKTNDGPDAWIDYSAFAYELEYIGENQETFEPVYDTVYHLPFDIDAQTTTAAENSFFLHNSGAGILKWDAEQRHVSTIDAWGATYLRYPKLVGTLTEKKAEVKEVLLPKTSIQVLAQESTEESMLYFDDYSSFYYVGETDLSYSNSEATRFQVTSTEGFNLTNVQTLLNYTSSKKSPVILEVYAGQTLEKAKLKYQQELTDVVPGWNSVQLTEQLFLDEGTYFWLVLHVPAGPLYPLGTGVETNKSYSENCYISFNFGKSWTLFEDLYGNNLLTWAIVPSSFYKNMGEYFTVAPLSGSIDTNDSTKIDIDIDASKLINGTYNANVVVNTNESGEPMLRAPLKFNVTGQKPIINSKQVVDLGSTVVGTESVHTVSLSNTGYGNFSYPDISFSNSEFSLASSFLNTINPQSEYSFQIKYKPEKAGNSNAKVTLSNYLGDKYSFLVSAVAAEPPVAKLIPDSKYFDDVTIGDTVSGEFFLKNEGKYPLTYYFPTFTNSDDIKVGEDVHMFGYSAKNNQGGVLSTPEYKWYEISGSGTSITDYSRENRYWFYPVELGFGFPFFGETETQVYVTNYGLLSFDTNSSFNFSAVRFKDSDNPDRMISAYGQQIDLGKGGAVYYQDLGDMFVVQYEKVILDTYDWNTDQFSTNELTFEIVLHNDGNISIYYKDTDGLDPELLASSFVGIEDQNQNDGLLITEYNNHNLNLTNNTAIEITNPGLGLVFELSNPNGTIGINDSVLIEYKAKTDILNMGLHTEKVPVITNDPFNNPGIYSLNINVTKGGDADLSVLDSSIDFGDVFQSDEVSYNLWVINAGKASDTLISVTTIENNFSVDGNTTAILSPNRKQLLKVSPKTSELGEYKDTIVVVSKTKTLKVALHANIVEAPEIHLNLASITDTLQAGELKTYPLTVSNNGGNNLYVAPENTDWIRIAEHKADKEAAAVEIPEFTYNWSTSNQEKGPQYSWEEIKNSGTKVELSLFPGDGMPFFSDAVELPFSFNFYGKTYNSIHIGYNGVITLNNPDGNSYPMGATGTFPNSDEPNNIIAPMWAFSSEYSFADEYGIFYKIDEDHITVEWVNFIDGFGMGEAISYQAIIYASGNIKYQYNYGNSTSVLIPSMGAVGIENEDGTVGTTISYREGGLIFDKTAILLTPIQRYTVAPESSMAFDLTVNTSSLYSGTYTNSLSLLNNAPGAEQLSIPVSITVEGSAKLEYEGYYDFGTLMVKKNPDAAAWEPPYTAYRKKFEIKNSGVDSVEVSGFDVSKAQNVTIEAYVLGTDFFGNPSWQWNDVQNLPGFNWSTGTANRIFIEPKSSMQLRATITPESSFSIEDTLLIETNYLDGTPLQIAFGGKTELPPVFNSSEKEIHVYTNTEDDIKEYSFSIDNKNGASLLDSRLELSIKRASGAATAATKSASVNSVTLNKIAANPNLAKTQTATATTAQENEEYNRVLQHEETTVSEGAMGFGGNSPFATGTRFQAPADGFNLTHVQTWYAPGDWMSSDIVVEIYAGDSLIHNATVIYSEKVNHTVTESDQQGELLTFNLKENQLIYPNEYFFIVFKYPTGAAFPQGVASVKENVPHRFMYGDGSVWEDFSESGYESHGWLVHAVEAEAKSSLWVELTSGSSNSIEAGEASNVELKFTAAYAPDFENYAELHVRTNDPKNADAVIPVFLHKNRGPQFSLGNETTVTVNENEQLQLDIIASDPEEDDFSLTFADAASFVTSEQKQDALGLTVTPDFESAGNYQFSITGTDEHGNSSDFTLNVNVVNVNRVPETTKQDTIVLHENGHNAFLSLNELFADPDEDVLNLISYNVENSSVAKAYATNNDFVIVSGVPGITAVTFSVEDGNGATASNKVVVKVLKGVGTGINDKGTAEIKIYPTITATKVNVVLPNIAQNKLNISVLSMSGLVVKEFVAENNSINTIDVSDLPSAMYLIQVSDDEKSIYMQKIIKR